MIQELPQVDTPVWIGGTGAVLGVAFLTANIAHDTMYSQILGKIDQVRPNTSNRLLISHTLPTILRPQRKCGK